MTMVLVLFVPSAFRGVGIRRSSLSHISVSPIRPANRSHRCPSRYAKSINIIRMRRSHRSSTRRRSRYSYDDDDRRARARRPELQKAFQKVTRFWDEANPSERTGLCILAVTAVAVSGVAANLLFHISLLFAFMIIPLVILPILFTVMASVAAFAFFAFASGAGLYFIGAPFMAVAFLSKIMFPLVMLGGVASFARRALVGNDDDDDIDEFSDSEAEQMYSEDRDIQFEEFDRELRTRVSPRISNVRLWTMSDVLDELDFRGLGEYRQLFIEERMDGRTVLQLTDDDIKIEFGTAMPLGDRKRLSQLVADLRRRSGRSS